MTYSKNTPPGLNAADREQDDDADGVREQLVEEDRMEGQVRLVGRPDDSRDRSRAPGSPPRGAEKLLVELVSEPPDHLGEQIPGATHREQQDIRSGAAGDDGAGRDAGRHPAPDPSPPFQTANTRHHSSGTSSEPVIT